MGGNPDNVDIWENADVLILRPDLIGVGQTISDFVPATPEDPFSDEWGLVGLLDGDKGFAEESKWDEKGHNAWGYGEIIKSFRNRQLTRKFTGLERNAVTEYLESPGDTAEFVIDAKPAAVYIAFEVRMDDGKVKRRVSTRPASIMSGGRADTEADMSAVEYTATIFPDTQKRRFIKQETGRAVLSIVVLPSAFSIAVAGTKQLKVIDSNGLDVTVSAGFVSGTPAKATVGASSGLVTGVASGASVITATYTPPGGAALNDTCEATVTA